MLAGIRSLCVVTFFLGGCPMRISRLLHAAAVVAVLGSGAIWAADLPKATYDAPAVNARYALNQTVSELNVDGVALSRVIDFLRQTSGANIVVNWKVLEGAGHLQGHRRHAECPRTHPQEGASPRSRSGLAGDTTRLFDTDANVIQITSQDEADKVLITKVYIVDDLVMTDN